MACETGLAGPHFSGPRAVSSCGHSPCTIKPIWRPDPHSRGFWSPVAGRRNPARTTGPALYEKDGAIRAFFSGISPARGRCKPGPTAGPWRRYGGCAVACGYFPATSRSLLVKSGPMMQKLLFPLLLCAAAQPLLAQGARRRPRPTSPTRWSTTTRSSGGRKRSFYSCS